MNETFGARLRRRREEQDIALVAIAEQTKIKVSLLEALERDDVSHWPSGIFRRAFIRAYAQHIGLDPDVVVREFLEVHAEPVEEVAAAAAASASDGTRVAGPPPTRLRQIMGSAIAPLSRLRRAPAPLPPADPPVVIASEPDPAPPVEPEPPAAPPPPPPPLAAAPPPESRRAPRAPEPDLAAVAQLCTELGRVQHGDDVPPLLREAARILDATGLIVWVWDGVAAKLRPALAHGYSDSVVAQLPAVARDADNATAAAFRSARTCAVSGSADTNGALVVPMLTPEGCGGVLAIELPHGREQAGSVRAVASIVAAQLAQLTGGDAPAEARAPAQTSAAEPRSSTCA